MRHKGTMAIPAEDSLRSIGRDVFTSLNLVKRMPKLRKGAFRTRTIKMEAESVAEMEPLATEADLAMDVLEKP